MRKRALISVSNKQNLVPFAQQLENLNYEIISTGGTLKLLLDAGIEAKSVETVTGFPEILDGRVRTLHPNVHGGLLAKREEPSHLEALKENDISPIDIVVVNLYPFKETVTKAGVSEAEIIENIDIGGPTMLRAAAKKFSNVAVVVDPADYEQVLEDIKQDVFHEAERKQLPAEVFCITKNYDA